MLVTEKIADTGLDVLRDAGHEVDVQLGLSPDELLAQVASANGLIIRSSTQVTAEVVAAAPELMVVGRAGVGLDNVDVAAATARGVMVVNAPQSNVLSAAEHTMALLLAQARNVPQAHAALREGRWERSQWTGVELSEKTLGIVGLGRIGRLVADRARAFGMRIIAHDPFVPAEKAAELNIELLELPELVARADFLTLHLAKTPETINLINKDLLAKAKPELRVINVARGGIINESDLAEAVATGQIAGAAIDVFAVEPTTESPLFAEPSIIVTPHLGASTHEAQDKAGVTIAEQVQLALSGDFVPFAVNVAAKPVAEEMRPFLPLCEQLGAFFGRLAPKLPGAIDIEFIGEIAAHDNSLPSMAVTKGVLGVVSGDPVSYVNALDLAGDKGVTLRTITTPKAEDHVNVIAISGGGHGVRGTLTSATGEMRIVGIDGHSLDLPFADRLLVVRNSDRPGMIGHVTSTLGQAGINVNDMAVGQSPGGPSLMAIITEQEVPESVLAAITADEGIESVQVV